MLEPCLRCMDVVTPPLPKRPLTRGMPKPALIESRFRTQVDDQVRRSIHSPEFMSLA